jgi:signal peptidase I
MKPDFSLLLVILTTLTGLIWLIDSAFLRRQRMDRAVQKKIEKPRDPVLIEYSRSLFPVLLIVLLFRSFLFEPFKIPSGSMIPTLLIGDFIVVNKYAYGLRLPVLHTKILPIGDPQRGDVVVFRFPVDPNINFIKRLVGVPGDTISYRGKQLYVNGPKSSAQHPGPTLYAGGRHWVRSVTIY